MQENYDVIGMSCAACQARVEKKVASLDGINNVTVNLLTNSMKVDYDENVLDSKIICQAVEKAGYSAKLKLTKKATKADTIASPQFIKNRLIASAVFLIILMIFSMGHIIHDLRINGIVQLALALPIVILNYSYYTKGFKALFNLSANMDSLIAISSTAALLYSIYVTIFQTGQLYIESAAMILTLVTLGRYFEERSKSRTSRALEELEKLVPAKARVIRNDIEIEVDIEELNNDDIVIIKAGDSIPVDGIVIDGNALIDEAALTGESIPVNKLTGDEVYAATIMKNGYLKVKVDKAGEDTVFSGIVRMVEEASSTKAPIARLADKVAGIFVPTVIAISLVTLIVWLIASSDVSKAIYSAICVLVISCPCALGLATPVAIMVGTGEAAKRGILYKSGEYIERLSKISKVVFDKTGTLTEGKPVLSEYCYVNGLENSMDKASEDALKELFDIFAALENMSEHPLGKAIVEFVQANTQSIDNTYPYEKLKIDDYENVLGRGVRGSYNSTQYFAGNKQYIKENGIDTSEAEDRLSEYASSGKTPILFANNKQVLLIAALEDEIKTNSKTAIDELNKMGIKSVMLTGDNKLTAQNVAKILGISEIYAEVMPDMKKKTIDSIKEPVIMVGDGINDAPALISADVGIAIGNGAFVAVESAGVVLIKNDIMDVVNAIKIGKMTLRTIKQNLFWAFFYNCLGIPLAAGVFYPLLGWQLSPMFGAAAMSFSSIFVVTNALMATRRITNCVITIDDRKNNDKTNRIVEKEKEKITNMNNLTFYVDGMMCEHCVAHVTKAVKEAGYENVTVTLSDKSVVVKSEQDIDKEGIFKAIKEAGYEAR